MEKEIFIRGRRVVYFEEGEGPPILIIHGWGPASVPRSFAFQRVTANQGYRVILLALPGFDGSDDPSPEWGIDEYLDFILEFASRMKLDIFFVIGHSLGGTMAIRLAVSHPERIKALILFSPMIIRPARLKFWRRWLFPIGFYGFLAVVRIANWIKLDNIKPYHRFFLRRGEMMSQILRRIVKANETSSYLPRIKQPTLVLWGKKDYNYLFIGSLMRLIPDCDSRAIPGIGHQLQETAPEKTAELVIDFIKKLES